MSKVGLVLHHQREEAATVTREVAAWLAERSADFKPAPAQLGSVHHPVMGEAPGSYVLDQ